MSLDRLNHERFEQLCALAAIGEVSAAEFAELNEHLANCGDCREIDADFRRMTANELGAVATGRWSSDSLPDLDEPAMLGRVLERAQAEKDVPVLTPVQPHFEIRPRPRLFGLWNILRGPVLATSAVMLLVCAGVGVGAYRLRDQQLAPALAQLNARLNQRENEAQKASAEFDSASTTLQQSRSQRETLQHALADAQKNYADLMKHQKSLEADLATAQAQLEKKSSDLRDARELAQQSSSDANALRARLHDVLVRAQAQENQVADLRRKLGEAEDEATAQAASGLQDGDAKEVFGARDLHIVDVYDVDATGKTKRGFGRVYFVEKKLLLFYAFDLQDKQQQRVASAFQAWGYRQGNDARPQNLGLFLMDDPNAGRWVLKVNNSSVLQRIDAVFVTLEPPAGSPSPRGRKLLYANLGGPPNHP